MKNYWIVTHIIKLGWADIILNMKSCKSAEGCALHSFNMTLRGSASETGNPVYNNTQYSLLAGKTRTKKG